MTTERLDALIDSLLEMDTSVADLDELVELTRHDREHAARLDEALETERTLRAGGDALERCARRVDVPRGAEPQHMRPDRRHRRAPIALGASWALTAASVLLAVVVIAKRPGTAALTDGRVAAGSDSGARLVSGAQAEILGELPPLTVGLREGTDGRMEVLFLRAQVEQASVSDVFRLARDEHGRIVPVRSDVVSPASRQSM